MSANSKQHRFSVLVVRIQVLVFVVEWFLKWCLEYHHRNRPRSMMHHHCKWKIRCKTEWILLVRVKRNTFQMIQARMVLESMVRDRLDPTNWPTIGLIGPILVDSMNQIPKRLVPSIQLVRPQQVLQLGLRVRLVAKSHHLVEPIYCWDFKTKKK